MTKNLTAYILASWSAVLAVRVLLGSTTSAIAYLLLGLFWLVSIILLVAAIRQLLTSTTREKKLEAICVATVLLSFFGAAVLRAGELIAVGFIFFLVSACVLACIYGRRMWRSRLVRQAR